MHHFMNGFVLSRSSLHAYTSRFGIVVPPPAPPVFNVVVRFALVIVLSVFVLARGIVDLLTNIKSGGVRGGLRVVFNHCGNAACIL